MPATTRIEERAVAVLTEDGGLLGVAIPEGAAAAFLIHLVQQDTHRPQIHAIVVPLVGHHLRSEVQRVTADGEAQ